MITMRRLCAITCSLFWYLSDAHHSVAKNAPEKIHHPVINARRLINKSSVIRINIRVNTLAVSCAGLYIGDLCPLIILAHGLTKLGLFDLPHLDVTRPVRVFAIHCVVDGKSFVVAAASPQSGLEHGVLE